MIIADSATLTSFCGALRGAPYIAVDTEFMREKSYYARLCLVQVAHGDHAAAIDPLAPGIDLAPLRDLLLDPATVKVFHAAGQDLEIFFEKTGRVPAPVYDTQIAAAACGLGEQPSYASVVASLLGEEVDKSSQITDWSRRPLTDRQVAYALGDVTHLCHVYERLVADLAGRGRTGWVAEEMAGLLDERRYRVEPWDAWRRLRVRGANRKTLVVLREVAAWRERTAMERDLPRPWVLHDDAIVEIAQNPPTDREQLGRIRALKGSFATNGDGKAVLEGVQRALALPVAEWPELPERRPAPVGHESLVALLQALLRLRCEANGVATRMVASREDLDLLATSAAPDIPALHGWRREIFGADALALREGRLALTGDAGSVVARPVG
jgi:ribonuclease D